MGRIEGEPHAHALLSREETERVLDQLQSKMSGGGTAYIAVSSTWNGDLRWARNRASMTSDRRDIQIYVLRIIRGGKGSAVTNQIDEVSLEGVVKSAERQARAQADQRPSDLPLEPPVLTTPETTTWSDRTVNRTVEESAKFVQQVTASAEAKQVMSAGYIESYGMTLGIRSIDEYNRARHSYNAMTQAQCTVTVRHPKGMGSGWAGLARYDLAKIDEAALAARAMDKCLTSLDPVRIEPGRYTVILEPQAVADLVQLMIDGQTYSSSRMSAEDVRFRNPYFLGNDESLGRDRSKLGLKIVDERITISHDPSDPELGILAIPGTRPITWIEKGVLTGLTYERYYAIKELNEHEPAHRRLSYRMEGGNTSIDEMIAGTKRGLLVTRFSNLRVVDKSSLLTTGFTRDGLWLIENGRITKAVRNMRFSESPLFALNNVAEIGVPTPVYQPFEYPAMAPFFPTFALNQVIVPPLKVNDFSFTSTIDAV
jgi:predicted Zn-dependent protease